MCFEYEIIHLESAGGTPGVTGIHLSLENISFTLGFGLCFSVNKMRHDKNN